MPPIFSRSSVHTFALTAVLLLPPAAGAQMDAASDARVDSIFASWDSTDSPGCALGVYRDGEMAYSRGYGMADLERRVPITPRSVFDIGSTSKQFAAASVVMLAHEGKLSLDDDARVHVPELPEYARPITIRHLLLHTSGLRDYIGLLTLAGERIDDVTTPEDALAALTRQRELNFEPGDEHLYSNSGYFLLSVIVERVSGQSLRDFARERIFEPLGMTRTHYLGSYDDIVPDRALAYSPRQDGELRSDMSRWLQLGDGAVFTNVEELLLWDRNFYEPRVGSRAMLDELQTPGRLASGSPLTYALGLSAGEYRGLRTVSHGGAWGGYRAELLRFPEQRYSVAVLCNLGSINPTQLARRVADVHLAELLAPAPAAAQTTSAPASAVTVPETALREVVGTYRSSATRALLTVVLDSGVLHLTNGRRLELRPRSTREFDVIGAPVQVSIEFEPATQDRAARLRSTVEGQEPTIFERIELATPGPAELAAYAGSFHSEELQATYTIEHQDGALTLHRRGASPVVLRAGPQDEFVGGPLTLRFTRGSEGEVTGFQLDVGRVRNLRFDRAGEG